MDVSDVFQAETTMMQAINFNIDFREASLEAKATMMLGRCLHVDANAGQRRASQEAQSWRRREHDQRRVML